MADRETSNFLLWIIVACLLFGGSAVLSTIEVGLSIFAAVVAVGLLVWTMYKGFSWFARVTDQTLNWLGRLLGSIDAKKRSARAKIPQGRRFPKIPRRTGLF